MTCHENTRFRITTWPGIKIPHPGWSSGRVFTLHPCGALIGNPRPGPGDPGVAELLDALSDDEAWAKPSAARRGLRETVTKHRRGPLPNSHGEIYLELAAVNLDNDAAVLAFVNK